MTYGKPHTVRGWPDSDIVTTVRIQPMDEIRGYTGVVRPGNGPVILVPTAALTPVNTTPAEPEPGAWLIGETPAWHDPHYGWRLLDVDKQDEDWFEWPYTLHLCGGRDVPIVRLVPEPEPVELPWDPDPLDFADLGKTRTSVRVAAGGSIEDENVVGRVGNVVRLTPETAEAKAGALLAAARAAREVKP